MLEIQTRPDKESKNVLQYILGKRNIYQDDQHGIPDIYHIHYIQNIQDIYQDDQHDEVVEELLGDNPVDQFANTEREHNVKNCLLTQIRFQQKVL